jgi:hypothetical protein
MKPFTKDQGGLAIEVLELKNECLITKWLFKILTDQGGVWSELIHNKYLHSKSLSQVTVKPNDSPFWKGLLKCKDEFFEGLFKIGDGVQTRFWEDDWLGNKPLAVQYSSLYHIVQHKKVSIAHVLSHAPLTISFRQALMGNRGSRWLHLARRLVDIHLTNKPDMFVWKLTKNGLFMVKSLYLDLMNDHTKFLRKESYLRKSYLRKIIRIFMWFLHQRVLLTKDNLLKRNWHGFKNVVIAIKMKQYNTYS